MTATKPRTNFASTTAAAVTGGETGRDGAAATPPDPICDGGPTPLSRSGGTLPPTPHAWSPTGDGATGPSAPSEPVRPVTPLRPNLNWELYAWQPDQAA